MNTNKLKKFAQAARRQLIDQVGLRLEIVLQMDTAELREKEKAIKDLQKQIAETSKAAVIERVAYIWFNRFCALRFMDVNRYTKVGTVSPAEGFSQPEILQDAKQGHIDDQLQVDKQKIFDLLGGHAVSTDPQGEAYRLLVVAACNFWNKAMPFLFQRIDDYTELLMPDDLLSGNSILAYTREAMTPDACEDVEVIGWLYQFYISEKKDEVFDGLKKNKKITPENIPAATQLFTPHWIVRYLVENSLGRLWLLNRPGSKLVEQMAYYIKPEQAETDFLRITKPEEIKICDPACGSGHMLTYAFDLLYAIYEEEGYEPAEIPEKILTNNLFGIEIDERAGELAAFALTMKARARQRRFFNKGVKPNICVLENVHFDGNELKDYMDFVGRDLFTAPLQTTLRQFEEADNFGSLIRPDVTDVDGMLRILESKNVSGQLFISMTHQKVLQALRQADYLSPKYHVVIANPPYMGNKGMNGRLAKWAKDNFNDSKTDLSAMFIERNLYLVLPNGMVTMITMQGWMFLSFLESLRTMIIEQRTITSMAHLGTRAFDSIGGEVVSTTAFVVKNARNPDFKGNYLRLIFGKSEAEKASLILAAAKDPNCGILYQASTKDFKKIPNNPIAYWINDNVRETFVRGTLIKDVAPVKQGLATSDNERFLRFWSEVGYAKINRNAKKLKDTEGFSHKWYPHNKGGSFRKWYGNQEFVVNWQNNGEELWQFTSTLNQGSNVRLKSRDYYFKEGASWSDVTTGSTSARYIPEGFIFDTTGPTIFDDQKYGILFYLGLLNSKITMLFVSLLNPTLHFTLKDANSFPIPENIKSQPVHNVGNQLINLAKFDWNSSETSWDFTDLPVLNPDYRQSTLKATYQKLRTHWQEMTLEMQRLEQENNRIFIDAYGLQDELTPEVPLGEITLTCNPHYRYGNDKSEDELEALLLADTMRELVSYAVGCMFGRYSLDIPGLVLANQGDDLEEYSLKHNEALNWGVSTSEQSDPQDLLDVTVERCSFLPDWDNVIPMLDGNWFTDDITERFYKFLRVTFGEEHYEENLQFIEKALNIKGKRNYTIRDYFLKEFYTDHVKRYKKRPIYWLFASPKGSFNALIYMHRYRPDTVSIVLNDYLREFRTKLTSRLEHLKSVEASADATKAEKTRALKEIEKLKKTITELDDYERNILYPLATQKIEIDLDDGVKTNYPKFGKALKKVVGLS
jgi:type II restriction/modification system DNA methylase subunit YeeA